MRRSKMETGMPAGPTDNWVWGQVLEVHHLEQVGLVKYHPWVADGVTVRTGQPDPDLVAWHVYVNGQDTRQTTATLGQALAVALAHLAGMGEGAPTLCRMLGLVPGPLHRAAQHVLEDVADSAAHGPGSGPVLTWTSVNELKRALGQQVGD